jgi:hypothetical protein
MDVVCKRCRAAIAAADVNIERMIAKCASCNAVFAFADQLGSSDSKEPAPARREVAMPERFALYRERVPADLDRASSGGPYRDAPRPEREDIAVEWRWYKPMFLFLLLFTIAWDAFLINWYFGGAGDGGLLFIIFPIAHVGVGVALTYYVACGFLNRTRIAVEGGDLVVDHRPLPWRGRRRLRGADVEQLYCQEKVDRDKHGRPTHQYRLRAVTRGGKDLELLDLDEANQALYLERLFEEHLGIDDAEVPGQMRS